MFHALLTALPPTLLPALTRAAGRAARLLGAPLLALSLLGPVPTYAAPASPAVTPPARQTAGAASPRVVPSDSCRRVDPNLVRGACLRYRSGGRDQFTWIGSYRAPSGRVFFCIDYLYDSRLPTHARVMSTHGLVNQLGDRVGPAEVAALDDLVSRWAPHGSTGSADRDAAIALVVREVMGDGRRPDGTVVYPAGLHVDGAVRGPRGGLPASVLGLARDMWAQAARDRGPYAVELTSGATGPLRLGQARRYRVAVRSTSGALVAGVPVRLSCHGPVRCPSRATTAARPVPVVLRPHRTGRFELTAVARGPAADGRLYVAPVWTTHGGHTARDAGVQRGWIAQRNTVRAVVGATAVIVRAQPQVSTTASDQLALPGAALHDDVVLAGLPRGYDHALTATLWGPYDHPPSASDCGGDAMAGRVHLRVTHDGSVAMPPITVSQVGSYVWTESLPGDRWTLPATTPCGISAETTTVRRLTPSVSTEASRQEGTVGASIRDTVTVTGIDAEPVAVQWTLHGPLAPLGTSCSGLDWTGAPVRATDSFAAAGDGSYTSPSIVLREAGCYSYSEALPATATTEAAASLPGQAAESTLVTRRHPRLTSVVSSLHASTGDGLHDVVRVHGLRATDVARVRWQLLGPVAPRGRTCVRLEWGSAPVATSGSVVGRGSGRLVTPTAQVTAPGCYTFVESSAATRTTDPALSPPGLATETTSVVRPPLPVTPVVPSGLASRSDRGSGPRFLRRFYAAPRRLDRASAGGRLLVPSLGIEAPVDAVGLDRSVLAIPGDTQHVGWLARSAAAGDVTGAAVISGHVSDRHDRPGALAGLHDVQVGALVEWVDPAGQAQRFRVSDLARYSRARGLPAGVFRTDGPHLLRLITCTDRHAGAGGRFHYADNLVVTAEPVR